MLKKILEDMFVPEEILNNISDDDKQLIFIEIRKEQIRRYNMWQCSDKSAEEFHHKPNLKGKNIKFVDDTELVSILGERAFDRPIEEILKEETLKRAQEEAERVILSEFGVTTPEKGDIIKGSEFVETDVEGVITIPPEEVATVVPIAEQVVKVLPAKPPKNIHDSLENSPIKPIAKRPSKSADEKREDLLKRKSTEIYNNLISQHSVLEETAIKENEALAPIWEKVEEQARIDDELRRKKAIEARKFYATIGKDKSIDSNVPTDINNKLPPPPPPPSQKSSQLRYVLNAISTFENLNKTVKDKNDIKAWFLENEWNKKRIVDKVSNKVPLWFHGMISRQQCEKLLSDMDIGSFLIRVSEKCFCYVLSYKAKMKVKHILIESKTEIDQYEFVGPPNKIVFKSLKDLINYFQKNSISDSNQDLLTTACGQITGAIVDYMSLIQPDSSKSDKQLIHKASL